MLLREWRKKTGRSFARARDFENYLGSLAAVARAEGLEAEARGLESIGARAQPMAEAWAEWLMQRGLE